MNTKKLIQEHNIQKDLGYFLGLLALSTNKNETVVKYTLPEDNTSELKE